MMNTDTLLFFGGHEAVLPLYEKLIRLIETEIADVKIKVSKTQIGFYNKRLFGCVSFLRVRKAQGPYITVTLGLGYRLENARIDAVSEPYPKRFTHHIMIENEAQIDAELLGFIKEAAAFSASKR